jgi:hypothetical protein
MEKRILFLSLCSLFALFILAGGALAAKKSAEKISVSVVLPKVDVVPPPEAYVGRPTPLMYEATNQPNCDDIDPECGVTVIQHDQWGSTYYDYQQNGSMGRMIAVGPGGYKHMIFHETRGPYSNTTYPRYVTYNCKDPLNNWLDPIRIDGGTDINAGYANIGVLHNGRAVVIYHRSFPPAPAYHWATTLALGDKGGICSGSFIDKYDVPDWLGSAENGMWPKMGIVYDSQDTDYIHIGMTESTPWGDNFRLGYVRCHLIHGDTLLCETPTGQSGVVSPIKVVPNVPGCGTSCPIAYFGECEAPGVPPGEYPNTISLVVATSPVSQKVAIVFTNKRESGANPLNNDVFYFESTNNGIEWFPQFGGTWPPTQVNGMLHNITNYPTNATERAYMDVAACYDYNDNLHIVWNGCYYDSVEGYATYDANLYHWSQATGISLVAPGYWDGTRPGDNNRNISKMSISAINPIYHPDSVYLFVITWTQFNPGDTSRSGWGNGDIYAAVSNDGGQFWTPGFNLTNTQTPNCLPGTCLSEHWSSLAENMYNGDLHIEYVCDRDAGGVVIQPIPEGTWTDNPLMYLHVTCPLLIACCRISYTVVDPPSWTTPPIKVPPGGSRHIEFQLKGRGDLGGNYQVTSNHPKVQITSNPSGHLSPGQTKTVEGLVQYAGEEFINGIITIRYCIGTADEDSVELPLYAVCSDDYYECKSNSATTIEKDNDILKLWVCANTEKRVWDKRIHPEDKQKVIFSGGVIVATTAGNDTVVGRQDYKDTRTGARDTLNVVEGYDYYDTLCHIQKIHVEKTYIWFPPVMPQPPKWWWININKEIILFHDRPNHTCPDWKKEQVIKYVWIEWGRPPLWWPDPGTYSGHQDIYLGVFSDVDAPFDTGCNGCNTAGYDYTRQMVWQHGYNAGQHPEYVDHYVGLALTDTSGAMVEPFGCQDVLSEQYLYPQDGWGWKEGELYQLAATSGVNIDHPDSVADRTVVLTVAKIPTGTDTTLQSEFILIEASIQGNPGTGLAQLQTHIDDTRNTLIPELQNLGLFSKNFPICGDLTDDGMVDASDIVYLLNYLFVHGPQPPWPMSRADVTNEGEVDAGDLVYLLNYLFVNGPEPHCSGFGR